MPGIRFKLRNDLLYYSNTEGYKRLYIPEIMEGEVFRIVYNLSSYGGFYRTYNRLVGSVYIKHLARYLRTYIQYCPDCQLLRTTRYTAYGLHTPVSTPSILFYSLALDFIVELPEIGDNKFNIILTLTDKFTKKVILLPGKDTWDTEKWANVIIVILFTRDWGIPRSLISNRDRKFILSF